MIKKAVMFALLAAVVSTAASAQNPDKPSRRERFDRGLAFDTKTPSMPKGMWVAGMNVSYSQHSNEDFRILVVDDMNSTGHTFNISPMVHYVFANNQSIGLRFAYKRNMFKLDELRFNINQSLSDMLFGGEDLRYQYQSHTYMGYLSYRYYVGLGANKRFLIFNEVQAGFGGGQQREDSGQPVNDGELYKRSTYQNSFNFRLGFAPGIAAFMTNAMAVEIQIGLLGYEFKKLTQHGTGLEAATRKTSKISTNFDFLSIAFGMAFYL